MMVGVRRFTAWTVAHSSSRQRAISAAPDTAVVGRACKRAGDDRIAALGPAHRLHDVAEEARVQIAEEADEPPVRRAVHQHLRHLRLRIAARRGDRIAVLVERLEILAVERDPSILARQHRVRLRARGDQDRAGRQPRLGAVGRASTSPAAWPNRSTSTARGDRPSAKRTPSSSAFATSSWFSV